MVGSKNHILDFLPFFKSSTFTSISFTTDYADFTDYFLQMDFAITQIFSDLTDKKVLQGFEKSV